MSVGISAYGLGALRTWLRMAALAWASAAWRAAAIMTLWTCMAVFWATISSATTEHPAVISSGWAVLSRVSLSLMRAGSLVPTQAPS